MRKMTDTLDGPRPLGGALAPTIDAERLADVAGDLFTIAADLRAGTLERSDAAELLDGLAGDVRGSIGR